MAEFAAKPSVNEVLIVEENVELLYFFSIVLYKIGKYQVRPFSSGHAALLSAQANPPDVIILEINIPDISGYELCAQLKLCTTTCMLPVIFCSTSGTQAAKNRAFAVGCQAYLTKPVSANELITCVQTQIDQALLQESCNSPQTFHDLKNKQSDERQYKIITT